MTHRHDLRWGNAGVKGAIRAERDKGEKKWGNYNNIINKIYLRKRQMQYVSTYMNYVK